MRRNGLALWIALCLALAALAPPAAAQTTTSSTSSSTTSTTTSTTTPPPPPGAAPPVALAVDPNNLAQQASEVAPAEAQLVGLLATVRARLTDLNLQLQALDKKQADNVAALAAANQTLADRQAAATAAAQRVTDLAASIATARDQLRRRAVDAYVRDPTGELANLILHLKDPAELDDLRTFYNAVIDVQSRAVARYDKLKAVAVQAAKQASVARDQAQEQQLAVSSQQALLASLRTTLAEVARESQDQQAQETSLLGQASSLKDQFLAAVNEQQQKSDEIAALLRQLEQAAGGSNGPPVPASAGYFGLPIPGAKITSPFGPRLDPILGVMGFHPGVDFGANFGTPIEAAGDGTVVWAGPDGGYGNCTIIDHGHSLATLYAHQSNILVRVGDQVTRGQVIGQVGSTGYSTGPHLHFEVRVSGTPVDPVPYL